MEGMVYECQCGHVFTEAEIDLKAKKAVCKKCKAVVNLRAEANRTEEVITNGNIAAKAFLERDFDRAENAARHVLALSSDNIPALYINAYYSAFCAEKRKDLPLQNFFNEEFPTIEPLPEEIDMLKQLILFEPLRIAPYEQKLMARMIEVLDDKELGEFTEGLCPKLIISRMNSTWFTPEMIDVYSEIAKKAVTAKTWFALYKQIGENPDSPEKSAGNVNPIKAKHFYDNFVLGVEKVYNSIADAEQKVKFTTAFAARKQKFLQIM